MENTEKKFYTTEEENILKSNLELRQNMISKLTEDGKEIPTSGREVRLLKELLDSADEQIHKKASARIEEEKLKLKEKETKNNEDFKNIIANVLLEHNKNKATLPVRNEEFVEVNENDIIEKPVFIEGEDSDYQELNPDDFTKLQ